MNSTLITQGDTDWFYSFLNYLPYEQSSLSDRVKGAKVLYELLCTTTTTRTQKQ